MELDIPAIGPIEPLPDGVDAPFWDGLNHGELRLQRCSSCRRWIWAPQWRCGACGSWDMIWEVTPARGRVYGWTRTWHPFFPGAKEIVPYVILAVELPHADDRRLLGILVGEQNGLRVDAEVEGVIQSGSNVTSGQAIMRWRLVGASENAA